MASLQARHSRRCVREGLRRPWTSYEDATAAGCICRPGPMYYVVTRVREKLVREAVGHNRKLAERRLRATQVAVDEDRYEPPSNATVNEVADEWLASLRRRSTTRLQYATTLSFARAVFGTKRIRKVSTVDVLAFLRHVEEQHAKRRGRRRGGEDADSRVVSEATLAKHLRQLSVFFEAARRRGVIAENPVRRLDASAKPKPRRKRPSYLTDGELARLWPELAERPEYAYAMKLAATTGMRFGEIAGLRLSDVSLSAREIQLERQFTDGEEIETPKDREPRTIDLVPAAVEVLEEWLRLRGPFREGLLFERERGGHLANDEARDLLYDAMKRAGIERIGERGGKRDVHSFRHTFARIALEHGAELTWVQKQLGHSSITLTRDTYGHWSRSAEKVAAERLAGAFAV
jgi:integrase